MTSSKHLHCLYYSLREGIRLTCGLPLSEGEIFALLGGLAFNCDRIEGAQFPSYNITGNHMDYGQFLTLSGVHILRIEREPSGAALLSAILADLEAGQPPIAETNTFHLSYNESFYKKTADVHVLTIRQYDEARGGFLITDNRYDNAFLPDTHLIDAILDNKRREAVFIGFEPQHALPPAQFGERLNKALSAAVKRFLRDDYPRLVSFRTELLRFDAEEGILKRIACETLAKVFKHPSSPEATRLLMAQALLPLDPSLSASYEELAQQWRLFNLDLLRFSKNSLSFDMLAAKYDHIVAHELACISAVDALCNRRKPFAG